MHEKSERQAIRNEIERRNFVRAAIIAEPTGLPDDAIRNFRIKAVKQMSAVYRNVYGTKHLARQYGFSKDEAKQILQKIADEIF